MRFAENDIISTSDGDYFVSSKVIKNNESYSFLIKINENEELEDIFDIVKESSGFLEEIKDDSLFSELYEEFIGNMKSDL